jgi:phosphogluconate dehydratase
VTPEALDGGAIGKIRTGDIVRLDAVNGTLDVLISDALLDERIEQRPDLSANEHGMGRELFRAFRNIAGRADEGASVF